LRDRQEAMAFDQLLEKIFSPQQKDLLTPNEQLQLLYELLTLPVCYFLLGSLASVDVAM
jgi:hypothetical protein